MKLKEKSNINPKKRKFNLPYKHSAKTSVVQQTSGLKKMDKTGKAPMNMGVQHSSSYRGSSYE